MEDPKQDEFWLLDILLQLPAETVEHIEEVARVEGLDLIDAMIQIVNERSSGPTRFH